MGARGRTRQGRTDGRRESERARETKRVKMSDLNVSFALCLCVCVCVCVRARVFYLYNNLVPITVVPSLCTCGFLDIIVDARARDRRITKRQQGEQRVKNVATNCRTKYVDSSMDAMRKCFSVFLSLCLSLYL